MIREGWLLAGLASFAAVGSMLLASSPASAAPCEHRSASHLAEHGGRLADDRWHITHGDLPSCEAPAEERHEPKNNDDDQSKSRYCRQHFFC